MADKIGFDDIINFLIWDYTTVDIVGFLIFGFIVNQVSELILMVAIAIKVNLLSEQDKKEYKSFITIFMNDIIEKNPPKRRFMRIPLGLLPGYSAWINFAGIMTMLKYSGLQGLVKCFDNMEKLSIIQLKRTRFEFVGPQK